MNRLGEKLAYCDATRTLVPKGQEILTISVPGSSDHWVVNAGILATVPIEHRVTAVDKRRLKNQVDVHEANGLGVGKNGKGKYLYSISADRCVSLQQFVPAVPEKPVRALKRHAVV